MMNFIKNRVKEFLNIYWDDEQVRKHYGNEYADRYSILDPATGKKMISPAKIITRVVIAVIVAMWVVIAVRMMTYGG